MIATKASRTLPPVEQCSSAPAANKSAIPAASTQFVEFFVEPQAASTLVMFVAGQTIDVSEFSTHLASCELRLIIVIQHWFCCVVAGLLTELSWKMFPSLSTPHVFLVLLMIRAAMRGATQELPLSVTS